jgi:hypothetical protein
VCYDVRVWSGRKEISSGRMKPLLKKANTKKKTREEKRREKKRKEEKSEPTEGAGKEIKREKRILAWWLVWNANHFLVFSHPHSPPPLPPPPPPPPPPPISFVVLEPTAILPQQE